MIFIIIISIINILKNSIHIKDGGQPITFILTLWWQSLICDVLLCNSRDFVARPRLCTAGPSTASHDAFTCYTLYIMTAIAIPVTEELNHFFSLLFLSLSFFFQYTTPDHYYHYCYHVHTNYNYCTFYYNHNYYFHYTIITI